MRWSHAVSVALIGGGLIAAARPYAVPPIVASVQAQAAPVVTLPNRDGSFKFAVLGDFGTGARTQFELARQMGALHDRFKYGHVILVGDNLYGSERPQDFKKKFEDPYKPLLDAGVKFYAALGNHDAREQRYYKLFNMDGKLYYTFSPKANIRFFILESTYPEPEQIQWVQKELEASGSDWKIPVFHHPLYSSGERHGSDIRLRQVLEVADMAGRDPSTRFARRCDPIGGSRLRVVTLSERWRSRSRSVERFRRGCSRRGSSRRRSTRGFRPPSAPDQLTRVVGAGRVTSP